MLLSITLNQAKIKEWGITINQAICLSFILTNYLSFEPCVYNSSSAVLIPKGVLTNRLPLFVTNERAVLNELSTIGLIKGHKSEDGYMIGITDKGREWLNVDIIDETYMRQIRGIKESRKKPKNKPTLDEIVMYINDKGYDVDANNFFKFYDDLGWVDSQGKPVKNWRYKLRMWNNRNKDKELKPKDLGDLDEWDSTNKVRIHTSQSGQVVQLPPEFPKKPLPNCYPNLEENKWIMR